MAGWASNNKWSIFGAVRSAAQMVSYEIPTVLAILVAVMMTGSLNLQDVTTYQAGGIQNWVIFGGPLPLFQKLLILPFTLVTFLILFVASLAEVNRTPFDLPEAESELVQGFFTDTAECGGRCSTWQNMRTCSSLLVSPLHCSSADGKAPLGHSFPARSGGCSGLSSKEC